MESSSQRLAACSTGEAAHWTMRVGLYHPVLIDRDPGAVGTGELDRFDGY